MRAGVLIAALIVFVAGCASRTARLPSDMEPAAYARNAVSGRTAADVAKVNIEMIFPTREPLVVTNKRDIAAMLEGLREAVTTKERCGCSGPRLQVFWKDGTKTPYLYICTTMGPKQAFGTKFAKAFNRVVPEDNRVKLYAK